MTPRKHQIAALKRYAEESIIPLFFDPGTGKTYTSTLIAIDKFRRHEIDTVLVIAPNGVDEQWARQELPKYFQDFPDIPVNIQWNTKSGKAQKLPVIWKDGYLNICCVNIDKFSTNEAYLRYVDFINSHEKSMIILDEATRIKNPKARRTERLLYQFNNVTRRGRAILNSVPRTKARIILTGTPITNGLTDVWAMFEFLRPGYFGMNWYAFQNKYCMFCKIDVNGRLINIPLTAEKWKQVKACKTYEEANGLFGVSLDTYGTIQQQSEYTGSYKHAEELRQLIMRNAMFVRIEDVADMPERTYIKKLVAMNSEQARIYNEMVNEMIAQYEGKETSATSKLTMYLRLQQIASGFIMAHGDTAVDPQFLEQQGMSPEEIQELMEDPAPDQVLWIDHPTKVNQLLIDLEEMNGPCIIVTHFTAEADYLYNELYDKYSVCLMTGWRKVGSISDFQAGKYQVMIANIRVISMGFNLQNAHHMIFYSNTFSLEDRIQVEARIYRTGQTNRCIYFDYITADTIDMKIYAALHQKKSLADYVTNKSAKECMLEWDGACQDAFSDIVF